MHAEEYAYTVNPSIWINWPCKLHDGPVMTSILILTVPGGANRYVKPVVHVMLLGIVPATLPVLSMKMLASVFTLTSK